MINDNYALSHAKIFKHKMYINYCKTIKETPQFQKNHISSSSTQQGTLKKNIKKISICNLSLVRSD